ncbi:hypothetical protein NQ314_001082 [Rhamnusium bicolor]|uniref:Uncharacterized protein n=1 Tax=Rhamnusium bicolor TaxID=1586634 RepID=A0AAV8ZUY6_9CUCU|nr:hypothetical protein NQ314_001082 [Rhamnusium bicolor]
MHLFLDDARMKNFTSCFKEKKFLKFFFNQLRFNNTERYREFPYISLCGKERNFVRCDDYPFVFTHVVTIPINGRQETCLAYNHAGDLLSLKFQPEQIFMSPKTGRVYHPAPERVGSIGLIRSKLAIEFSKFFLFDKGETSPPTQFIYNGKPHKLTSEWYYDAVKNKPNQTH